MHFRKASLILTCIFTSCFLLCAESLTISKIRITVGESEYLWSKDADIELTGEEESYISPYTVISYTSLFPGKTINQEDLDDEVMRTQMRLEDSGLFYTASVQIVPPRKNPTERTIIISVTEGFLHRFSGGNAYGMYGLDGLGGERSSLYTYAGWNLWGVSYAHENLFNKGVIAAASFASYDLLPSLFLDDYSHTMQGTMHIGKYLTPDIGLTLFSRILFTPLMSSFSDTYSSVGPVIRVHHDEFKPFDFSWNMETSALWYMNQTSYQIASKWAIRKNFAEDYFNEKNLGQKLTLAILLSGGYENSSAPEALSFNLYNTDARNVRSGYSKEELLGMSYALFSTELRYNIISLKIPPAFTCGPQVFAFTDIAFLETRNALGHYNFTDAYGLGLRLLLDNPIFAYFTFSFGWNHEGEGRFVFSATGGY